MLVRTREGAVGLWNVATGAPVPGDLGTKAEGEVSVWSAAARRVLVGFKAGGAHCLLMGRAGSVLRYDARTWKPAGPALRQHDDIEGPSVEVSPNGKWLLYWGLGPEPAPARRSDGRGAGEPLLRGGDRAGRDGRSGGVACFSTTPPFSCKTTALSTW